MSVRPMYLRVLLTGAAVLISACSGPSEPEVGNPMVETPIATAGTASPVAMAAPALASTTSTQPARAGAAIEDALVRLIPVLRDRSMAGELRPLLQEAQRLLERNASEAGGRLLDRIAARLLDIGVAQLDPDLTAVALAVQASR